jgi:hypothetical protein
VTEDGVPKEARG